MKVAERGLVLQGALQHPELFYKWNFVSQILSPYLSLIKDTLWILFLCAQVLWKTFSEFVPKVRSRDRL